MIRKNKKTCGFQQSTGKIFQYKNYDYGQGHKAQCTLIEMCDSPLTGIYKVKI